MNVGEDGGYKVHIEGEKGKQGGGGVNNFFKSNFPIFNLAKLKKLYSPIYINFQVVIYHSGHYQNNSKKKKVKTKNSRFLNMHKLNHEEPYSDVGVEQEKELGQNGKIS